MSTAKIAISIDSKLLNKIDYFVAHKLFRNRSQAFQNAIGRTIERIEHNRLARECAKLDPAFERSMAEEGFAQDSKEWPEY